MREPCPECGGSMRFCEHMDDPFAPVPTPACPMCGCGVDGDDNCPCGCMERTRETFALGAAWALGDDTEAPAALRAQRDRYRTAWKSAATRAGIATDEVERLRGELDAALDLIEDATGMNGGAPRAGGER